MRNLQHFGRIILIFMRKFAPELSMKILITIENSILEIKKKIELSDRPGREISKQSM